MKDDCFQLILKLTNASNATERQAAYNEFQAANDYGPILAARQAINISSRKTILNLMHVQESAALSPTPTA